MVRIRQTAGQGSAVGSGEQMPPWVPRKARVEGACSRPAWARLQASATRFLFSSRGMREGGFPGGRYSRGQGQAGKRKQATTRNRARSFLGRALLVLSIGLGSVLLISPAATVGV